MKKDLVWFQEDIGKSDRPPEVVMGEYWNDRVGTANQRSGRKWTRQIAYKLRDTAYPTLRLASAGKCSRIMYDTTDMYLDQPRGHERPQEVHSRRLQHTCRRVLPVRMKIRTTQRHVTTSSSLACWEVGT